MIAVARKVAGRCKFFFGWFTRTLSAKHHELTKTEGSEDINDVTFKIMFALARSPESLKLRQSRVKYDKNVSRDKWCNRDGRHALRDVFFSINKTTGTFQNVPCNCEIRRWPVSHTFCVFSRTTFSFSLIGWTKEVRRVNTHVYEYLPKKPSVENELQMSSSMTNPARINTENSLDTKHYEIVLNTNRFALRTLCQSVRISKKNLK